MTIAARLPAEPGTLIAIYEDQGTVCVLELKEWALRMPRSYEPRSINTHVARLLGKEEGGTLPFLSLWPMHPLSGEVLENALRFEIHPPGSGRDTVKNVVEEHWRAAREIARLTIENEGLRQDLRRGTVPAAFELSVKR